MANYSALGSSGPTARELNLEGDTIEISTVKRAQRERSGPEG